MVIPVAAQPENRVFHSKWHQPAPQRVLRLRHRLQVPPADQTECSIPVRATAITASCRWLWATCHHRPAHTSLWIPTSCPKVGPSPSPWTPFIWPLATPKVFSGAQANYRRQTMACNAINATLRSSLSLLLQPVSSAAHPSLGRLAACLNWHWDWAWEWMRCATAGVARHAPSSVIHSCRGWRSASRRNVISQRPSAWNWPRHWVWARHRSRRGSKIAAWSTRSSCDDATLPMVSGQDKTRQVALCQRTFGQLGRSLLAFSWRKFRLKFGQIKLVTQISQNSSY